MKYLVLGIVLVLNVASVTYGFSFWNDLRVTWGESPVGWYHRLPRTTIDADADGWVRAGGEDCRNGGAFNGFQYVYPQDMGIALVFDVNGFVAGIQSLIPQAELLVGNTEWDEVPMYQNQTINGVDYFVITAYFTHPAALCEVSEGNDGNIGTTSQVYFQNGYGPENLKVAFKHRSEASANGWSVNGCVPGMGWHNFYNVEGYAEHNCQRIQPTCLLYNEYDEMFGFCLTFTGYATSPRYEHSNSQEIADLLGNAPQCLLDQIDQIGATTVHIYFNNAPWNVGAECTY